MKIVQSFWTKPSLKGTKLSGNRFNGGWPHRKLNYMSWALSCLQLRKYYDSVELVTDSMGKEILIDMLQLPYSKVHVELDKLNSFHHGLWTLGKIYSYTLQDQPFLHVDNDVFIWERFSDDIFSYGIVGQNVQLNTSVYSKTFHTVIDQFDFVPHYLQPYKGMDFVPCVNAGIMGGTDLDFFHAYAMEVFAFITNNGRLLDPMPDDLNVSEFTVVYEQVFLYGYAAECTKKVAYLFEEATDVPLDIGLFHECAKNKQFVHCLGGYKQIRVVYSFLENRLKQLYPDYYHRIINLISTLEL